MLLIAPSLYERAGEALESVVLIRLMFGVIAATGLYFTYVGWRVRPARRSDRNSP